MSYNVVVKTTGGVLYLKCPTATVADRVIDRIYVDYINRSVVVFLYSQYNYDAVGTGKKYLVNPDHIVSVSTFSEGVDV